MGGPGESSKPPSTKRALPLGASVKKSKRVERDNSSLDDDDEEDDVVADDWEQPGSGKTSALLSSTLMTGNGYDAVLSESEDLLQAAAEAQQLGRLRMSASYLTLLHTRLVGLGKRFDKAISAQGKTKVTRELSDMMPHVEFDSAMMEHLAKAAEELHKARCGLAATTDTSIGGAVGTTDLRAMFASQLRSRLETGSPKKHPVADVGTIQMALPNCNARELLAGRSSSTCSEDEGGYDGIAEGTDDPLHPEDHANV